MRKALKQFGGEVEIRIDCYSSPAPVFSDIRPDVPVKRSIDFTAIDELCQIFKRMDLLFLEIAWIDNSLPVFVGKTAGSEENIHLFIFSSDPPVFPTRTGRELS